MCITTQYQLGVHWAENSLILEDGSGQVKCYSFWEAILDRKSMGINYSIGVTIEYKKVRSIFGMPFFQPILR